MHECSNLPSITIAVAHDIGSGIAQERKTDLLQGAVPPLVFAGLLRRELMKSVTVGLDYYQRRNNADLPSKNCKVDMPNTGNAERRHDRESIPPSCYKIFKFQFRIDLARPAVQVFQRLEDCNAKDQFNRTSNEPR